MNKRFTVIVFILCVVVIAGGAFLSTKRIFRRLEYIVLDSFFNLKSQKQCSESLVVLAIDEESLDHFGPWPWSRDLMAILISSLSDYSPKLICLDIFFSEKFPVTDFFIVQAMKKCNKVALPVVFETPPVRNPNGEICFDKSNDIVLEHFDDHFIRNQNPVIGNILSDKMLDLNDEIYENAYAVGHGHALPDIDGIIRRIPSFIHYYNYAVPQFALLAVSKLLNTSIFNAKLINNNILWIPEKNDLTDRKKGIRIPVNENGEILLNWFSQWGKAIEIYSVKDILISNELIKNGKPPLIPLNDILKNKICLVGLTALGLIDIKPTPLNTSYPMLGVHANLINSILRNDHVKEVSLFYRYFLSVIYPIVILICFYFNRDKLSITFFSLSVFVWPLIGYFSFIFFNTFVPVVTPVVIILLNFMIILIGNFFYHRYEAHNLMLQAITDELTGLYTHRYFKFKIQGLFVNKSYLKSPFSLLLLDIDNFKHINDTYGHENGNIVLKNLSSIIKQAGSGSDIINCRYGGEEFCVLLLNKDKKSAYQYGEDLLFQIRNKSIELTQKKLNITVSIGVVSVPGVICDGWEQFIQAADSAMYYAKRNGKNQVQYFRQKTYMYSPVSQKYQLSVEEKEHPSYFEFISIDLKKRNEELETIIRQMQKMQNEILEHEKQKMTQELSAYISHELNKPIHNISNCLNIIKNDLSDESNVNEFIGLAEDEIERVADLSRQMLDFYRPSEKTRRMNDINRLLEMVTKLSLKQFHDKGLKITLALSKDIPLLLCSGDELKQVFLNIIMNALDAMDSNGELIIKTEMNVNKISVVFKDNGKGIPEKIQDSIFDPFVTTKSQKGGTGIGLSVSYDIVKKHNGTIMVKSETGKGATFTVVLPVRTNEDLMS